MPITMSPISRRALIKTASLTPLLANSNMYSQTSASGHLVYAGTYTKGSSKGIYAYRFQEKSGDLAALGLMAETPNPTYLAISANHRALYAVNEVGNYNGTHSGLVSGFSIDHLSGKLNEINSVASGGSGPCHLAVDRTGHALF
ncbi:MAG TPA: beta-propeller fold lactonase family protein, partial [Bryobacteraceae bacterium]|nr:beta-propeller fold lactonase family protein [Bryobacteraceae bacterium]